MCINAAAESRQAGPSAAGSRATPGGSQVRAQRAADRAHNEAVIGGTDEQIAQALADEEQQVGMPLLCKLRYAGIMHGSISRAACCLNGHMVYTYALDKRLAVRRACQLTLHAAVPTDQQLNTYFCYVGCIQISK